MKCIHCDHDSKYKERQTTGVSEVPRRRSRSSRSAGDPITDTRVPARHRRGLGRRARCAGASSTSTTRSAVEAGRQTRGRVFVVARAARVLAICLRCRRRGIRRRVLFAIARCIVVRGSIDCRPCGGAGWRGGRGPRSTACGRGGRRCTARPQGLIVAAPSAASAARRGARHRRLLVRPRGDLRSRADRGPAARQQFSLREQLRRALRSTATRRGPFDTGPRRCSGATRGCRSSRCTTRPSAGCGLAPGSTTRSRSGSGGTGGVIDVGLRPAHAAAVSRALLAGRQRARRLERGRRGDLAPRSARGSSRYVLELAAIRPEQVHQAALLRDEAPRMIDGGGGDGWRRPVAIDVVVDGDVSATASATAALADARTAVAMAG